MSGKTVYPRQGVWFHVDTLLQLGEMVEFVEEWFCKTSITVISICGDDMKRWRLTSRQAVKTFCAYMRNNVGTRNLKLRMKQKDSIIRR